MILDEIDKLGRDQRGDPASALLEVLDPEQNHQFTDHYIDAPFDLSKVMFIATANQKSTIPGPLLDRMEVIELPGYTPREKLSIARDFLIPRQLSEHGLSPERLDFSDESIDMMVDSYTHEAGVRKLEQQAAAVCRAVAVSRRKRRGRVYPGRSPVHRKRARRGESQEARAGAKREGGRRNRPRMDPCWRRPPVRRGHAHAWDGQSSTSRATWATS